MIGAIRFLVMAFAVLTAVYLCLWFYARSVRREALEAEWARERRGARDDYVTQGLAAHAPGLRRRLLLIVYGAPVALFAFLVIYTNSN